MNVPNLKTILGIKMYRIRIEQFSHQLRGETEEKREKEKGKGKGKGKKKGIFFNGVLRKHLFSFSLKRKAYYRC